MEQGTQAGSPAKIHITRDDILNAIRIPNASQIPSASRSTEVPTAYSDNAPGQYNESAGVGQSRDHSTSAEFASLPAVQPTGIGFDFAESSLFIPQWGDRESYGAFGVSQDPSQLDALFADMLPEPSIG
jgi:hypothetical protein